MKVHTKTVLSHLCILLLPALQACAQPAPPGQIWQAEQIGQQAARIFSQQELDQMLAPIALYPDALLSQILMAATYPLEVVKAARWSAANRGLSGEQAVQAVEQTGWDPSVQSLVAFPQILATMEGNLDWTERLGDAFLAQQVQMMDTVQNLRRRAIALGNLASSTQISVYPQGQTILIAPANPQIVYVPYYDPNLVYGQWWWTNYPPVYWNPWPGYYSPPVNSPGYSSRFFWGSGIVIGSGIFFSAFDWHQHDVQIFHDNRNRWNGSNDYRPRPGAAPNIWQHNPAHRRGYPYTVSAPNKQFGSPNTRPDTRPDIRPDIRPETPRDYRRPDQNLPPPAQGLVTPSRPALPTLDMRRGSYPQPEERGNMQSGRGSAARPDAGNPVINATPPPAFHNAAPFPNDRRSAPAPGNVPPPQNVPLLQNMPRQQIVPMLQNTPAASAPVSAPAGLGNMRPPRAVEDASRNANTRKPGDLGRTQLPRAKEESDQAPTERAPSERSNEGRERPRQ